ncbi:MAG: BatD family protein [Gammaproteobacteria bacterium]|nr:BatD family protein [Gammaproteobacteria bacterium]
MVIVRRIFLLVMIFTTPLLQAATLQATVDRNPISEHEALQLTLTLRDYDGPINPDLTALEGLFDILGNQQSSQVSIINGRIDSVKQLQITLAPKQAGRVVIPTIEIGNLQSQPITLQVVEASSPQAAQVRELALEISVDNTTPYLQQQVILTVRLMHTINLAEGVLPAPEIAGVETYKLGDDKQYQTIQGGQRVGVIERRYALLPQQSGEIEIPSILFSGRSQERTMGSFGGLFNQGRAIQARSKPITLQVKPQPQRDSGIHWLPATQFTLQEQWSPSQTPFRVGEPITRTLTLQAHGLSASQLPELSLEPQAGFKTYPDQPQLETLTSSQGVIGTRVEKYAIVPIKVGPFTLPAITLTWWNSESEQLEVARLPEKHIQVLPAQQSINTITTQPFKPAPSEAVPSTPVTTQPQALWPWQLATALLAFAWLTTLGLGWRKRLQPPQSSNHNSAHSPTISLKAIARACHSNQPQQARDALLIWGKAHHPQQPPRTLPELAQYFELPQAQSALKQLDRAIYTNDKNWDGKACWHAIENALKRGKNSAKNSPKPLLPELYGP